MIRRVESAALLVRSVPYGEADVVATFFTRELGKVTAMVRGARRSTRRFGGALEPIHELWVTLEDRDKELLVLKEARIARPRAGIASSLEAMEAAGQALRWIRQVCPSRTPEPAAWRSLAALLDTLDQHERGAAPARRDLAVFGLRLLTDAGYGLELDRCVRCGRPCPEGRSAFIDAAGGGLVCTGCGGAHRTIGGELRSRAARAQRGEPATLSRQEASEILELVEDALAAHAGVGGAAGSRRG